MDTINELLRAKEVQPLIKAVSGLYSAVLSLSPMEAVGWAATIGVGIAVLQATWVWLSDCDGQAAAALKRMPKDAFAGKTVWIIGASSGIGEALAYECARRGANLILSARRIDQLMAVQDKCHELGSAEVLVQKLDVTAFDSHSAIVESVYRRFPRVDYLVNNAGRSQRGLVESTPLAVDRDMLELNVLGVMSVTKAVLPKMLAAGAGTIAFTSSVAGKVGSPISASYSATKHAVQGWVDSARMELQARGVHFVSVCPGPVKSEITLHAFTDTHGTSLGVQEDQSTRMSAERCAELYAAAMWARLPEIWLAPQPILLFVYIGQYIRWLYFLIGPGKAGPARVKAFRSGESGYGALQNVGSLLAGSAAQEGKKGK